MKVDVLLPARDGARYIGEAIESLLAQSTPCWHLTVIDDASCDGTAEIVDAYRRRHPGRIDLLRNATPRRAAGCRMQAARTVDGALVAFLDQDDRWAPAKLERQIAWLRAHPGFAALHTDAVHIDSDGRLLPGAADRENAARRGVDWEGLPPAALRRSLFARNSIRLVSAILRRDALLASGGFDETLFGGEDWEFWVRLAGRWRIGHLAEPLLERRIHLANATRVYGAERASGLLDALSRVTSRHPELAPLAGARRVELLRHATLAALERSDYGTARRHASSLSACERGDWGSVPHRLLAALGPLGRELLLAQRRVRAR